MCRHEILIYVLKVKTYYINVHQNPKKSTWNTRNDVMIEQLKNVNTVRHRSKWAVDVDTGGTNDGNQSKGEYLRAGSKTKLDTISK